MFLSHIVNLGSSARLFQSDQRPLNGSYEVLLLYIARNIISTRGLTTLKKRYVSRVVNKYNIIFVHEQVAIQFHSLLHNVHVISEIPVLLGDSRGQNNSQRILHWLTTGKIKVLSK